jgi:uncharacterized protein with PQ loop repeat
MQTGMHHAIHRHAHKNKQKATLLRLLDKSAYLMGAITVAVNIPQLFTIWTSPDVAGVSLVSWTGFFLGSCFWLSYGLLHREKPIITVNGALIVVQGLIVIGIIKHGSF